MDRASDARTRAAKPHRTSSPGSSEYAALSLANPLLDLPLRHESGVLSSARLASTICARAAQTNGPRRMRYRRATSLGAAHSIFRTGTNGRRVTPACGM